METTTTTTHLPNLTLKLGMLSLNPKKQDLMLLPAKQNQFFSITTNPSQDMLHEGQEYTIDGNSSYEEVTEGEDDEESYEDDLYIPPSNFENTNDPYIMTFIHGLCENNGHGSPVASFHKICYFNGADSSYAVPLHGNHIQPASQNIAYILEWWLKEKLSHIGEIPILEESPQISAESIMTMLRETSALNGLAKVFISIRAGHVYLLHMIGDEIVMAQNYEQFFQQFPLFVNVSIKVQEYSPSVRHNTCQVLVAVEHVTMKDQTTSENRNIIPVPCKFSHQEFDNTFTNTRVTSSSPDGQTFCLLEEVATNADVIGNGGGYFSGGGFTGGIVVDALN